jgi:peptide/nickel transport system permease protein
MRNFLWRLAGHVARGLVMIWVVVTFTFFLVKLMPGNPVQVQVEKMVEQGMTQEQAQAQAAVAYGFLPTGSPFGQYLHYLWRVVHFDLGQSVAAQGVPVATQVRAAVPWTMALVLGGILISFVLGVVLGVLAALRRSTATGHALSVSGSLLHGVPPFVIALVLFALFSQTWRIFPYGAPYDSDVDPSFNGWFIGNVIYHAVLPACAYALATYGGWLLTMKSSVVSVLGEDFVLAAELRGLTWWRRFRYLARNAMLPLFTVLAISIGLMFGGSIFIERIFNYQGLGVLLYNSLGSRDYPMMNGAFLLITIAVVIANILADLLYSAIDPRVRRVGTATA